MRRNFLTFGDGWPMSVAALAVCLPVFAGFCLIFWGLAPSIDHLIDASTSMIAHPGDHPLGWFYIGMVFLLCLDKRIDPDDPSHLPESGYGRAGSALFWTAFGLLLAILFSERNGSDAQVLATIVLLAGSVALRRRDYSERIGRVQV